MEYQFLNEFLIVLVIATLIAMTLEKFRLPAILGFLIAGVVVGPHGFAFLSDLEKIRQMAELGVILLMLTIGLEFSFDRFRGFKALAVWGGTLQILFSIGIAIVFALLMGWNLYEGFCLGSVIALSSTAIVLKYLIDRGELDTHHGRIAVSILIFQDLAVLPLMIGVKNFGLSTETILPALAQAIFKTAAFIGIVFFIFRYAVHFLLRFVASTRNREMIFLTSIVICLGIAWLGGKLGLSLAIGAFFAGFLYANTEHGGQLIGEIIPFRYVFVSIFFVSIGLLFDVQFFLNNLGLVLKVVGLVLAVNFVVMTFLLMIFGLPIRIAMATGIILSQIGEFSFLLIEAAKAHGGISSMLYQLLLSAAFLTMLSTPLLFALVPWVLRISEKISFFGFPVRLGKAIDKVERLENHVVLCGFGPSGKDLSVTLREEKIPFVLIEMNPAKIKQARQQKIQVIYGDAANEAVMHKAGIERAKAVIVSFADTLGMAQIIRVVQRMNPRVMMAVRTRYEAEMPKLYELGADVVVMEEWEASYELNQVVLDFFRISKERIEHHLERIQARKELALEEAIFNPQSPQKKSS